MKKFVSILMVVLMSATLLAGCGGGTTEPTPAPTDAGTATDTPTDAGTPTAAPTEAPAAAEGFEIAMITDVGTIDDRSFNQGTWEGIKQYAEEKGITHKYYQPTEQTDDAYLSSIDLAVKNGAKIVVTPGFLFEGPIGIAQDRYPDVTFVLIDGNPTVDGAIKINSNAVGITYAEEQAGFLVGYAAVKDGFTKLGFMGGMAVPAVKRYGFGFIQGAELAAKEMGVSGVEINYHYTGGFAATPEAQTLAATWYQGGTEVIFGCGGAVGNSVMAAAEASTDKYVIGVDVDQSGDSATVITSAMKGLGASVYQMLEAFYNGTFPGGQSLVLDATNKGVEIAMSTAKFRTFTQADYDAAFAKLTGGEVVLKKDVDADGNELAPANMTDGTVKVTVVE